MALTRMEAKVDVALAQHGAKIGELESDALDHEHRLRAIESKPTVTPTGLWTVVVGALGAFAVITTLYDRFML